MAFAQTDGRGGIGYCVVGTMNTIDDPLAYFITWTVYGTFLQGDSRWWSQRNRGSHPPQPLLEKWHSDRLKHDIVLLNSEQRKTVESAISRHSHLPQLAIMGSQCKK